MRKFLPSSCQSSTNDVGEMFSSGFDPSMSLKGSSLGGEVGQTHKAARLSHGSTVDTPSVTKVMPRRVKTNRRMSI